MSPLGDLYIVFSSISRLIQGSGKLPVGLIRHFIGEYWLHFGMYVVKGRGWGEVILV